LTDAEVIPDLGDGIPRRNEPIGVDELIQVGTLGHFHKEDNNIDADKRVVDDRRVISGIDVADRNHSRNLGLWGLGSQRC